MSISEGKKMTGVIEPKIEDKANIYAIFKIIRPKFTLLANEIKREEGHDSSSYKKDMPLIIGIC